MPKNLPRVLAISAAVLTFLFLVLPIVVAGGVIFWHVFGPGYFALACLFYALVVAWFVSRRKSRTPFAPGEGRDPFHASEGGLF